MDGVLRAATHAPKLPVGEGKTPNRLSLFEMIDRTNITQHNITKTGTWMDGRQGGGGGRLRRNAAVAGRRKAEDGDWRAAKNAIGCLPACLPAPCYLVRPRGCGGRERVLKNNWLAAGFVYQEAGAPDTCNNNTRDQKRGIGR